MDPLTLIVDLLACYRLTRLVTKDSLLDQVRWWLLRRWPNADTTFPDQIVLERETSKGVTTGTLESGRLVFMSSQVDQDGDPLWMGAKTFKWSELIECPYCASVWLAFIVIGLRQWWDWWQWMGLGLALAGVVALVFARLDNE